MGTDWRRGRSRCTSPRDRKSTRLNSSHTVISYAVFCLKKKKKKAMFNTKSIKFFAFSEKLELCHRESVTYSASQEIDVGYYAYDRDDLYMRAYISDIES